MNKGPGKVSIMQAEILNAKLYEGRTLLDSPSNARVSVSKSRDSRNDNALIKNSSSAIKQKELSSINFDGVNSLNKGAAPKTNVVGNSAIVADG